MNRAGTGLVGKRSLPTTTANNNNTRNNNDNNSNSNNDSNSNGTSSSSNCNNGVNITDPVTHEKVSRVVCSTKSLLSIVTPLGFWTKVIPCSGCRGHGCMACTAPGGQPIRFGVGAVPAEFLPTCSFFCPFAAVFQSPHRRMCSCSSLPAGAWPSFCFSKPPRTL